MRDGQGRNEREYKGRMRGKDRAEMRGRTGEE
jgi:hypothetical protein